VEGGGELIDNRKKNRLSKLEGKKNRVTGNNISSAAAAWDQNRLQREGTNREVIIGIE